MTEKNLNALRKRQGFGIVSVLGKGLTSEIKDCDSGEVSELERRAGHASVRPPGTAFPYSGRCVIRCKVFRRRLTDPLGDCTKYHIDALRYCGLLADDSDAAVRLEDEGHEKVESNQEERVEITLTYDGITLGEYEKFFSGGPKKIG